MKIKNKLILTFLFISFLNIRASHFSLDNEIKTIQTLPRKPQGVTLDIEVTKVKTEKINASIDEKNKKIKIDFTDKKNENVKKLVAEEKQYDIFVFDNPNDISFFSTTGKKDKRSALKLPKLYDYNVDEKNNNVISINYEEKPETLYVGVRDKNNNEVVKIYNTEITPYESFQVVISNGLAINNPVLLSTTSTVYAYPFRKNNGSLIRPEIIKSGDAGDGTQPGTKYSASENSLEPISTYGMIEEFNWTLGNNLTVSGYPLSNFEGISVTRVDRISTRPARLRFMNGNADISNNVSYKKWNRSAAANISAFLIQGDKPQRHLLFGMNSWDLSKQLVYTQFAAPLTPPTSIGSYQQTYISIPPFDPEAYYDNINSSIKIDRTLTNNGTTNPNMSTFWSAGLRPNYNHPPNHTGDHIQKTDVQNKTIELGTIKIFNSTDIPQIASDQLGKPLKFHAPTSKITLSDGSGNTITGNIFIEGNLSEITAEEARTVKKVYLELDELKNGTFSTADNIEILRLGLQTDNIFDDIISKITLTMTTPNPIKLESAIVINNPVALAKNSNITYPFKNNEGNGSKIEPRIINNSGGAIDNNYIYSATRRGDNIGNYGLVNNTEWITEFININGYTPSSIPGVIITDIKRVANSINTNLEFYNGNTLQNISGKKWNGNTLSGMGDFLIEGTTNGKHLTMGFSDWDLKEKTFEFKYLSVSNPQNREGIIYITLPPFDPEAYYDNGSSTIKIDSQSGDIDTTNFWSSQTSLKPTYTNHIHNGAIIKKNFVINKKINLGTIKILDEIFIPDIASDLLGKPLKFYTTDSITLVDRDNSNNKITGKIYIENTPGSEVSEIDAKDTRIAKNVYLELDTLKKGTFIIDNAEILRLGIPTDGIFDDIISKIELTILINSSFIIDYEPKILDFGAVIENQFSANEAKTRINITYDTDLNNPNFTYELQKDDGSKTNYYNDFKLYQNGDKTSTNFAIADLWLGIEGTPNSNEPNKKTLDLNGRLKNINNAPILGGTSTTYKNIVNIIVTLEEAP